MNDRTQAVLADLAQSTVVAELLAGRIVVNEARPQEKRPYGGSGRGGAGDAGDRDRW